MSDQQSLDNLLKYVARTGKIVIGFNETLRYVKTGRVRFIVIASNIPESMKSDIEYYAKLSNVGIIEYPGSNRDLGTLLGKPFSISTLGIVETGQVSENALKAFVKSTTR
ncbi:50S ribosomal protein L30e [Ignisphaera sp. 4213-co]|uniref:Large ribosomal subunit protein eL30 n=1 Tax=Ignisphaera cupida TaxID=3050454 RepID=A0ABD4Z8C3_9CREN|nr:50S ribosomal protein L30e [Ignisphaera sp. 4213-co]MDK6028540.1 50S ribosomal protein L30e [Ignisphaera sp. 4213-co]